MLLVEEVILLQVRDLLPQGVARRLIVTVQHRLGFLLRLHPHITHLNLVRLLYIRQMLHEVVAVEFEELLERQLEVRVLRKL